MDRERVYPNDRSYAGVIRACCQAGQWEKGLTLMYSMEVKGEWIFYPTLLLLLLLLLLPLL